MKNLIICIKTLLLVLTFSQIMAQQAKPNLIIIQTDEHNFRTLSCYQEQMSEDQAFIWGKGNNIKTPNIDAIAHGGAICTKFYASSPVCTPSRASLVSGLYPQATGAPKNGLPLSDAVTTFAQVLKNNGYATSYLGKWHLDGGEEKYQFGIKRKFGFDDNRYMFSGGHSKYLFPKGDTWIGLGKKQYEDLNAEDKKKAVHVTDFLTDHALEILERDKAKPFCMMISIPDPHTPDEAKPPYNTMYDNVKVQAPKTMNPELNAKKPKWGTNFYDGTDKNEATEFKAKPLQQYFGMVNHIDDNIGKILAFLDKNGLTDNTIILFTSDHGDMYYEHNRVNKDVPYEASARIPFVIRYPNKIPKGKVIQKAFTTVDFAPTILGIMGINHKVAYHGTNWADDFTNNKKEISSDHIAYYAKSGGAWVAAVDNRYKLILSKSDAPWLIDLKEDPDEVVNVYKNPKYADIVKRLQPELFKLMNKYKEPALAEGKNKPLITN